MTDRVTALVRDIEAIPDVYQQLADDGAALNLAIREVIGRPDRTLRRLVLTGLGSSRFAAVEVEHRLRGGGLEVVVEPATTNAAVVGGPDSLCVAISSSGRTREVIAAAERHRAIGRVLAITRDPASPLAHAAHAVAVLPVPAEESGIATTTYAATLAALLHLASALGASPAPAAELAAAAGRARAVLSSREQWLPPALEVVRGIEAVSVLAPWSERGHAEQVALLLREAPRRSAEVGETGEWLHVGIYTALPGSVALVLGGSPAGEEVARTFVDRRGRVIAVHGDGPGAPWPAAAVIPSPSRLTHVVGPALLAAELWRSLTGG